MGYVIFQLRSLLKTELIEVVQMRRPPWRASFWGVDRVERTN